MIVGVLKEIGLEGSAGFLTQTNQLKHLSCFFWGMTSI